MPWLALATWDRASPMPDRENALLLDALRREGVDARLVVWTRSDVDWSDCGACVIRTPWDYPERLQEFLAWVDATARRVPLWNPPDVVRWNVHKRYLLELAGSGVPIVETALVPQGMPQDLSLLAEARGWRSGLVVKPAVGVGSIGAHRSPTGATDEAQEHLDQLLTTGDALVQPYLRSVEQEGEVSLLHFGGELSHAIRKVPKGGDWRVQAAWGGRVVPHEPTAEELDVARRTLAALERPTLHARVDLVRDDDGAPRLMELEVIEPHLFLEDAPGSADRAARAIKRVALG